MRQCAVQLHPRRDDCSLRQRNDDQRDDPDLSQLGSPLPERAFNPVLPGRDHVQG